MSALYGVEGSLWVAAQQEQEDVWKPSHAPSSRIVTGEQAQAIFAPSTVGARRVEGPVNI